MSWHDNFISVSSVLLPIYDISGDTTSKRNCRDGYKIGGIKITLYIAWGSNQSQSSMFDVLTLRWLFSSLKHFAAYIWKDTRQLCINDKWHHHIWQSFIEKILYKRLLEVNSYYMMIPRRAPKCPSTVPNFVKLPHVIVSCLLFLFWKFLTFCFQFPSAADTETQLHKPVLWDLSVLASSSLINQRQMHEAIKQQDVIMWNNFCIAEHYKGSLTVTAEFPSQSASDAQVWVFPFCLSVQSIKWTAKLSAIWDVMGHIDVLTYRNRYRIIVFPKYKGSHKQLLFIRLHENPTTESIWSYQITCICINIINSCFRFSVWVVCVRWYFPHPILMVYCILYSDDIQSLRRIW